MPEGINIKFPFENTTEGGVFAMNKTTSDALRDDLLALLTLRRGQRPMQSRMYSPIYDYIFEPMDESIESELTDEIKDKVGEFIPQVEISKIIYNRKENENLLEINIKFTIAELFGAEQNIVLNIPIDVSDGDGTNQ